MNIQRKCKLCNSDLYVLIFKNKSENIQKGLYCSKCGKYHKFLSDTEVFYAIGTGMRFKNTYGDLSCTKLRQLTKIY